MTGQEAGAGDVGAVVAAGVADVEEGEFLVGGEEGAEFVGSGVGGHFFSLEQKRDGAAGGRFANRPYRFSVGDGLSHSESFA